MEKISLSQLQNNPYKIIDCIIQTGAPLEIIRRGHRLQISLNEEKNTKLSKLVPHKAIQGDPDELIDMKVGALPLIHRQ